MKTLYAKRALITGLKIFALTCIPSALCIAYFLKTERAKSIIFLVFFLTFYCYEGIYKGIKIYLTHWIKYGEGKVKIKRISKDYANGKPIGKWKNREDEFLLEDIEAYGMSWQVLGQFVEYRLHSRRGLASECFFQLKNGKKVSCETLYFDPDEVQKFLDYISRETGIKFQETSRLVLKGEKEQGI